MQSQERQGQVGIQQVVLHLTPDVNYIMQSSSRPTKRCTRSLNSNGAYSGVAYLCLTSFSTLAQHMTVRAQPGVGHLNITERLCRDGGEFALALVGKLATPGDAHPPQVQHVLHLTL